MKRTSSCSAHTSAAGVNAQSSSKHHAARPIFASGSKPLLWRLKQIEMQR